MKSPAYDEDDSTYITNITDQYMRVDSSMEGEKIRVRSYSYSSSSSYRVNIDFLNGNKELITTSYNNLGGVQNYIYDVPIGTKWIRYRGYTYVSDSRLCEIQFIE